MQSSTFSACSEKSAKLTPAPFQVAPSGYGRPGKTGARLDANILMQPSLGRAQHHRRQRRQRQHHRLRAAVRRNRLGRNRPEIAQVASAVKLGIGVQNLAIGSGRQRTNAIIAMRHGRCVDDHDEVLAVGFLARKRNHALRLIGIVDPFETCRLGIEKMERRKFTVEPVAIAHQPLHAGVYGIAEQTPVELAIVIPFARDGNLVSHEEQFLSGMREHERQEQP